MVQVSLPSGMNPARRRQLQLGVGLLVVFLVVSYAATTAADQGVGILQDTFIRFVAALIGAVGVVAAAINLRSSPHSTARRVTMSALGVVAALVIWFLYLTDQLVRATVQSVVIAIVVSAVVFVAANRWFDASLADWRRFSGMTGVVVIGGFAAILVGNRNIGFFTGSGSSLVDRSWMLVPILGVLGGAYGVALSMLRDRAKLLVGSGGGAVIGLLIGAFFRSGSVPSLEPIALVAATAAGVVLGAVVGRLRGRALTLSATTGAALGWLLGSFGIPTLGTGSVGQAIVGTTVLGAIVGARLGLAPEETMESRIRLERKARATIFLAPALLFIAATLVIPTIRTAWLSLLNNRTGEFVGLGQYRLAFGDPNFYNISRWADIFTSVEFLVFTITLTAGLVAILFTRRSIDQFWPPRLSIATGGSVALTLVAAIAYLTTSDEAVSVASPLTFVMIALVVGIVVMVARYLKHHPGNSGISGGSGMALTVAVIFLSLALFTNLRGTLFNNMWWVFLVTTLATGVGLAIAALSDGAKGESFAKAMIFMPMAISFVGASIIWRFMYIARPPTNEQTGVLNFLWVGLGRMSNSAAATPIAIGLFLVAAGLALLAFRGFRARALGIGWGAVFFALPFVWLGARFLTGSIGGVVEGPGGQLIADPILFLSGTNQVGPYNNFFIMVPFIWIYTGFAMVIFSAAIKGVPSDLIDASNVDGATASQRFWRVVVPQIAPTIGVVITTIIVTVMKVFDMVAVMTNGNFGTEVLANAMWKAAFTQGNLGLGSAIAIMLFLLVLPIMFLNIRRMQKEFH